MGEGKRWKRGGTSVEMFCLASLNSSLSLSLSPHPSRVFIPSVPLTSSFPNVKPKDLALICCSLQKRLKEAQKCQEANSVLLILGFVAEQVGSGCNAW